MGLVLKTFTSPFITKIRAERLMLMSMISKNQSFNNIVSSSFSQFFLWAEISPKVKIKAKSIHLCYN